MRFRSISRARWKHACESTASSTAASCEKTIGMCTRTKAKASAFYDASTKMWHQTWVTNRGELLLLSGRLQDGEMILSGHNLDKGKLRQVRGIWKPEKDGAREIASTSLDGGETWTPWFDLMFRPHRR
jgi:hypothetical protein